MTVARYLKSAVDLPKQRFIYRLVHRPAGIYLPAGYEIVSLGKYNGGYDGRFGTIAYDRPLTESEKKSYELLECVSVDEAVSRVLANAQIVNQLSKYVDDKRTTIRNENDNPFAYFLEDFMFKARFYCDWKAVLVELQTALRR